MNARDHRSPWFGTLLLTSVLLAGCASTLVKESWKDPKYQFSQVKKILVVGIARRDDVRRRFENACVQKWASYGKSAIASHTHFPSATPPKNEDMQAFIKAQGVDVIMVAQLKDRGTVKTTQPATTVIIPNGSMDLYPANSGWYDYYNTGYQVLNKPAQETQYEIATIETKLFDARSGAMVRSVISETVYGQEKADPIPDFVSVVVREISN